MALITRAAATAMVGIALAAAGCGAPRYDVVLRHGWIVDGTGNPALRGDVAIAGDRVVAVGQVPAGPARREIDVTGLVVAPGFIDMLGQSETNVLADGRAFSKVTDGITTEITGEGNSVAPQTDATIANGRDQYRALGITVDWRDLNGYFKRLESAGSAVNIATFVGATQVRQVVLGDANRAPTPAELERMTALVDTAMRQGALGVSTALVYAPAFYAATDELVALAKVAHRYGGIYASHIRDEGARMNQALDEVFRIAREADIPAEIWHLKRAGHDNWGDMPRVLGRIDSARAAGLDITADQYPYNASFTDLKASIPQWAHEGGDSAMIARLEDRAQRAKIRADIVNPPGGIESFYRGAGGAEGVLVASVLADSLKALEGKTIAQIASLWRADPIDALMDLIIKDHGNTGAIYFSMNEADVVSGMRQWWVGVNTDYGGVAPDGPLSHSKVHPRSYGSFARILGRYVREQHVMPLEFAIRKMTSLAAHRVGLKDRGLVLPGFAADITVFDPNTIMDQATFERPHQASVGVKYVFVNGVAVLDDGKMTAARPGRGLRGPGWVKR
jgi:dihydroorotase/N-acyl-D-amino-acid deacylase